MLPETPYSKDLGSREPIAAMRESVERIRTLAGGMSRIQLERSYAPGKWTARQLLLHLAQTELALGNRARMALTVPSYQAQAFNQDSWVSRESKIDARDAIDAFSGLARMNISLFESLSPADRQISLSHPEYGALTVDWIICTIAGHQLHHLPQLEAIAATR